MDSLAVVRLLFWRDDRLVAHQPIEGSDAGGGKHVEPADDHRRRPQHEQPKPLLEAVAVEINQDVDARLRDDLGSPLVCGTADEVDVIVGPIPVAALRRRIITVGEQMDLEAAAIMVVNHAPNRLHPVAGTKEGGDVADTQLPAQQGRRPSKAGRGSLWLMMSSPLSAGGTGRLRGPPGPTRTTPGQDYIAPGRGPAPVPEPGSVPAPRHRSSTVRGARSRARTRFPPPWRPARAPPDTLRLPRQAGPPDGAHRHGRRRSRHAAETAAAPLAGSPAPRRRPPARSALRHVRGLPPFQPSQIACVISQRASLDK